MMPSRLERKRFAAWRRKLRASRRRMRGRRAAVLGALVAVGAAAVMASGLMREPRPQAPDRAPLPASIVARGRIEPAGRIHEVSGPSAGGTIQELNVQEGSAVRKGDVLAVLDTHASRQAAVNVAQRERDVAERVLEQVSAGAKRSEIDAQRSMVAMRKAQLEHARLRLRRTRGLVDFGGASSQQLEQDSSDVEIARRQLVQAASTLRALSEVRPADLQVSRARLDAAAARLRQARIELDHTYVRAPIDGTVLAIRARTGSRLGEDGLLSLGDTQHPIAVAEFDEADAAYVMPGSAVLIALRGTGRILHGRVAKVLNYVFLNDRPTTEVLKGRDARVVEGEITFDAGQDVPALMGLELTITVPLPPPGQAGAR